MVKLFAQAHRKQIDFLVCQWKVIRIYTSFFFDFAAEKFTPLHLRPQLAIHHGGAHAALNDTRVQEEFMDEEIRM